MTRRTVALSLAVAMVWVTPVLGGPDQDGPPDASVRALEVRDWNAPAAGARSMAAAADDWVVSDVIDAGDAVLVGADWGGDSDTEVQVRTRDEHGWSGWTELHRHSDHVPDLGSEEGRTALASTASDPVFVGRVDDLQFRVQGSRPDLDVNLVDIAGDLSWSPDDTPGGAAAVAATTKPTIRPRASWGADESIRDRRVDYADDVRFSVVHHEGGTPRWSQAAIRDGCRNAASAINAIYEYHVKYRGYWDIAYNFVVDPCGGIWEGRHGGIEKAVQGAHAAGWNEGSVGVLALGTFSDGNSDPVTDDMVRGIERLLTWKLDHHHTDPRGTTREISGSGSSNRYSSGTAVNVPILSAHQITNSTSCPGGVLMDRLFNGSGASATPTWTYTNNVYRAGLPKAFDKQPSRWTANEKGDRPDWDVTFTETLDWSLRITDEDGELVRATGGTGEDRAERTWDLRDADGGLVDAGRYTATLTGSGASGAITPVVTDLLVSPTVSRRMGDDRIGTAIALSEWAFETADVAIVASATAYPDALVSSPLAGALGGPVLLTDPNDLNESVEDEIDRLGASRVIIVGGRAAVGQAVADELESDLDVTVERLGGADRFATAALVAEQVLAAAPSDEVLISLGVHAEEHRAFPDALSAGAFGAELKLPVILTATDTLPEASRSALSSMEVETVTMFGGTMAIAESVERRVAGLTDTTVDRFAGETRFDTSRLAAEDLLARQGVDREASRTEDDAPIDLIFASGQNWPDALGAGAAAAATGSLFLLTPPDDLDHAPDVQAFLDDWAEWIGGANVAGGPAAVAGKVLAAISEYVTTGKDVDGEPIDWPADPNGDASVVTTSDDATVEPTEPSTEEPTVTEEPTDGDTGPA